MLKDNQNKHKEQLPEINTKNVSAQKMMESIKYIRHNHFNIAGCRMVMKLIEYIVASEVSMGFW